MDIRTKLALALVSISLFSMLLLGGFAYRVSSDLLQDISERQLDALAESKKQDLLNIVSSWEDDVRLIRSRTQLRIRLRDHQVQHSDAALEDMQRIVEDAQLSTAHVQRIALFDRNANVVALAGHATPPPLALTDLTDTVIRYSGFVIADGSPDVIFRAAVELDEELLGSIEVVFGGARLAAVAGNYRGLGDNGETMIVATTPQGQRILLHPLRHATVVKPVLTAAYVQAAVDGREETFISGIRDYRGEPVWAATRFVPDTRWGLVVKMDTAEESGPLRKLRSDMIDLALALGAFAVVGGTLLGFYLARPIRDLAQVIERARCGEMSVRAEAGSDDEIGLLARTINNYLDEFGPGQNPRPDDDRGT